MNRPFSVHTISDIFGGPNWATGLMDGSQRWVTSVFEPYDGGRLRAAWWVLTGRAFAVVWPTPGDLEAVLGNAIVQNRRPAEAGREALSQSEDSR